MQKPRGLVPAHSEPISAPHALTCLLMILFVRARVSKHPTCFVALAAPGLALNGQPLRLPPCESRRCLRHIGFFNDMIKSFEYAEEFHPSAQGKRPEGGTERVRSLSYLSPFPLRFTRQSSPRKCMNPCKIESHCILLPIYFLLFVASCHVAGFLETSILS